DLVLGVVDEAVAKGVRGLVVITAGFAETGDEGAALENELRDRVRAAGIRMVGPNCMGVINTDPAVALDATFAPVAARRGSIGFVSQSGALGVAILTVADQLGIGLTEFVSMGNKTDVSGNDLLERWEHDDATKVIAMYLESFGNPRHFVELAKRVGRTTPILVVKSGRTAEGARAATSHTGALAGADVTVAAFLEQCGVLRADSIEDLFHMARAFDCCPLPAGPRVAIVTNAGGPGIMATDACVGAGLELASLAESTRADLAAMLPPEASVANPVDMIASADAPGYRRVLARVLEDDAVDMALAIHVTPLLAKPVDVLEACAAARAAAPDKAVLAVIMAHESFYDDTKTRADLPPVYRFPEPAAHALAALWRHAAWRNRPTEPAPVFTDVDDEAVARLLDRAAEDGQLDPDDALAVLEAYRIPVAPYRRVDDLAQAQEAARDLGHPVVLKAIVPGLVHKRDVGAVVLGLADDDALARALAEMDDRLRNAGHQAAAYLVQAQRGGGHEVVFGITTTDPRFGPLVMFGLGGTWVEVLEDVRFGVPPLDPREADDIIRGIRGAKLLDGLRGDPPVDHASLRDVLLRLAQLAVHHPRIAELDINPFLATSAASTACALDARIRVDRNHLDKRA
ncbi:MAG: acetate--CoA ligase family protein, partial [Acidobacteriota bacterium]